MKRLLICICLCTIFEYVTSYRYHNVTTQDAASQQLMEFVQRHPKPVGVITRLTGEPLDVRDMTTMNTDLFLSRNHYRQTNHFIRERIPERVIFAKGTGAFGYFEVTNDVSKYIKSDVFNGVGKKTPIVARFSTAFQNLGGTDLSREFRGMSVKMYTKEGNLDFVCMNHPVFPVKDPINFHALLHSFKRNPRTDKFDQTARWDYVTANPNIMHSLLWVASDLGIPDGYRKMNGYAMHTYEIVNKHRERFYVKFNFRTETGLETLSEARAQAIFGRDPDYFHRDLYNAIADKNYPSWKLEMDVMSKDDVLKVDFDPFDITRLWKRGTYHTVQVGRIVFNRRVDNHFKDVDQSAYSPDNLVPGIMGPMDVMFRARKVFYPDTQNNRLGVNYANIEVNKPLYEKTYSRDGRPPVLDNMRDVPVYYPNSFNGPMPYVDEDRRKENIEIYHRNAVDLEPASDFYNKIIDSDGHRQRIANFFATSLRSVPKDIEIKALRLLSLIDKDLGHRVKVGLQILRTKSEQQRIEQVAQCIAYVNEKNLNKSKHHLYEKYH